MQFKNQEDTSNKPYLTYDQMNTLVAVQKLWIRMGVWNRSYIRALIYDTPNIKSSKKGMLSLPAEVGSMSSIFFGTENGKTLENLSLQFNETMMEVIEAMKYGDLILTNTKVIEWYHIADEIATFLAKINIYWDKNQWQYLLYQYIKYKIEEVNAIVTDNTDAEINLYNLTENINFLMSNYFARGVLFANTGLEILGKGKGKC
ncbi:hypothetical protein [Sinanaerobacter sp. ZZT-01]|uniref:hypothetical protein n=1 Tax=Sinanaerobacter sp. ZZT-01 TaxID=3111540 RepID=UPI002D777991|nr:hypothetical protein [Sinanaerobacter sp. ZZT-01]WRR93627.1 hypothetical protein U5921_00445 [Sinanaerobacter sp. ZZT-01]